MSKSNFREYSPGTSISNGEKTYVIEETISQGKLGYLFACRDDWGYPRILQILWPFSRSYENLRQRWSQQAVELQRVQHPGLAYLFDSFEHDGRFHLVHERSEDRLDRQITSPDWDGRRRLLAVARPLLCALEHVHRSGYMHRDLHPRNVFCATNLAQSHPDSWPTRSLYLADLAVNTLLGNVDVLNTKISRWQVPPEYLSPSECGPMDHRVDIYQAALLLLCVVQGRIVRYSFAEISTGRPAKDAEALECGYRQALAQALQPKVAHRFESARAFWSALTGSEPEKPN